MAYIRKSTYTNDMTVEEYIKQKPSWQGKTHFELTGEHPNEFRQRVYAGLNPSLALTIINNFYHEKFSDKHFYEMWRTRDGKLGPEDTDSHLIVLTAEEWLKKHSIPRSTRISELEKKSDSFS